MEPSSPEFFQSESAPASVHDMTASNQLLSQLLSAYGEARDRIAMLENQLHSKRGCSEGPVGCKPEAEILGSAQEVVHPWSPINFLVSSESAVPQVPHFQVRDMHDRLAKVDFERRARVLQLRNDSSKIIPQACSSPRTSNEPSLVQLQTTLDLVQQELAETRHNFEIKLQSVTKETQHHELSMKLGDALLEMLKPESKVAEFVESIVNLTVGPLKDELATLQRRVMQLSDPQQETEEHSSFENCPPSAFQPQVCPASTISVGHNSICEYSWQESIWDVSMFIGTELLGNRSSLATGMCLVLYLFLFAALVLESGDAMSKQQFGTGTQSEFQYWRSTIAHDLSFRIPVTGESLASSVCHNRLYVPYANLQQGAVGVLSQYLEGHPVFGTSVKRGVMMCSLVLSVWFLKIIQELGTIFDFLVAFLHLPISKRVTFQQDAIDPSFSELVSVSRVRMVVVMVSSTVRVILTIFVSWFGSVFLIQETSLTNMVLNAMALQMMLDLDGLIFAALLPKKPCTLIKKIKSLKYKLRKRESFQAWIKLANVLLVMVSGVLIKMVVLNPFAVELQKNLDALCGGVDDSSRDFVMKVDSIGVPWAASTPSSRTMGETYAQHAVSEVIKVGFPRPTAQLTGNQRANLGLFMQVQSALELENHVLTQDEFKDPHSWTIVNADEMATVLGWNEALVFGHTDFGDAPGTVYNRYLQFLLGASGKISCDDVPLHRCYESGHEGLVMRKLCPSWCGCDLPTGGTISNAVVDDAIKHIFPGCTAWTMRKRRFRETLRDLPCVDTIRSDVFIQWVQGIGDYHVPQASRLLADQLLSSFEIGGCDAVAQVNLGIEGARICAESSLPAVCPISCGCDKNANWTNSQAWRMDYCPQDCGRLQSFTCFTIFVNHTVNTGSFGPNVDFPCVFPFKYKDKTYNECTTDDWFVPWCAVTLQNGRLHHWGDCPPGC